MVSAATQAARSGKVHVSRADFLAAIAAIASSLDGLRESNPILDAGELQTVESGIKAHLDGQDLTSV